MATKMQRWEKIISFVLGFSIVIFLLIIAIFIPDPSEYQIFIFRVVLAISGGALGTFVTGAINLELRWLRNTLRASAGLALFAIIYLINPPKLIKDSGITGFVPGDRMECSTSLVSDGGDVMSILHDSLAVQWTKKDSGITKKKWNICAHLG